MRWKLIAVTALFLWISAAASFAADMEVMLIPVGTEEEMNRYELPDHKGFLTNLKSGDTEAVVAAFSFDDGLSYELYRDGEQVSYVNEMLIQASGSYEMRVFSSYGEDRAWASFPFTITEFDAAYLEEFQFGKVIEQPEMEMKFHRAEGEFEFFFPNGQSFRAKMCIRDRYGQGEDGISYGDGSGGGTGVSVYDHCGGEIHFGHDAGGQTSGGKGAWGWSEGRGSVCAGAVYGDFLSPAVHDPGAQRDKCAGDAADRRDAAVHGNHYFSNRQSGRGEDGSGGTKLYGFRAE